LPFTRLAKEFDLTEVRGGEAFAIVMGDQRVGLRVDSVEGQQDTVIRAIQEPIQLVRGIAGATELGDQEPVLEVSSFIDDVPRRKEMV
jgi:two-component system chemotaxis sensor kinase CheA